MTELLDSLLIRFPARPGYLAISRLNVTAMAAGAGFDVESLDDLRLAVDEAVTWLVGDVTQDGSDGDAIELTISCEPGLVECRGRRTAADGAATELGDLAGAILGATVDQIEVGTDADGGRFIDLVKRSTPDG